MLERIPCGQRDIYSNSGDSEDAPSHLVRETRLDSMSSPIDFSDLIAVFFLLVREVGNLVKVPRRGCVVRPGSCGSPGTRAAFSGESDCVEVRL